MRAYLKTTTKKEEGEEEEEEKKEEEKKLGGSGHVTIYMTFFSEFISSFQLYHSLEETG